VKTWGLLTAFALYSLQAAASIPPELVDAEVAVPAHAEPVGAGPDFDQVRRHHASLEIQIALHLYAQGDDFRAVTALKRWMVLDQSPYSESMGHLMIGQVYRRNRQPGLAIRNFQMAALTLEPQNRLWAHLMANQELCDTLFAYVECRARLSALQEAPMSAIQRDVLDYQLLFTDVVLRRDSVNQGRAQRIRNQELSARALGLVERDRAFDDLPTKSKLAAGLLSIVPGMGQVYNGRYVDAALSLGLTGGLGALTWYTWTTYESIPWTAVLGSLTLGFYVGNIVNAVVDAERINTEIYRTFFEDLRMEYWPQVGFDIDGEDVVFSWQFRSLL